MPTIFRKTDFARWICDSHPEFEAVADYINSQIVLLKYQREVARFYRWAELEKYVLKEVEG